jgi:fimbrial chaperone protein
MRTKHRVPLAAVILCILPLAAPAHAAWLVTVVPGRIDLGPDTLAGAVTLTNDTETPITVEVQTFAWLSQAIDDLAATRDVLAAPALVFLQPGAKQVVRVALRGSPPSKSEERAYRLLITEVPDAARTDGASVPYVLRLSLPIFFTPAGARPQPEWRLGTQPGATSSYLELTNYGTAHIEVRRIVVRAPGAAEPVQVIEDPTYVLAGQADRWLLLGDLRSYPQLRVEADTDYGPIETELAISPR